MASWLLLAACVGPGAPQVYEVDGQGLGTTWSVKWTGDRSLPVGKAVVEAVADVDAKMSTWREDSELSRARAAGELAVSEDTAKVVREALALAEATGGAFDPTVQPLMELWGFHGTQRESPPSDDEISAVLAGVGWQKVQLGRGQGAPWLVTGGTALDLSAIAKGYAVDRAGHALSALGVANWMVEIGGEVRAAGEKAPDVPWRLGIDTPDADQASGTSFVEVVELTNAAMATSGNYRNVVELEGTRFAHTLDPRLGRPVETSVLSATVIAPDCMTADGLATALMVLPQEDGLALIEARSDTEALLVVVDGEGYGQRASAGFHAWVRERDRSGAGL